MLDDKVSSVCLVLCAEREQVRAIFKAVCSAMHIDMNFNIISERWPKRCPEHAGERHRPRKREGGGGNRLQGPPDDVLPRLG